MRAPFTLAWVVPAFLFSTTLLTGCDDDTAPPAMDLASSAADLSVAVGPDLSVKAVQRGPLSVPLTFEPAGLFWDDGTKSLYISTSSSQIVRWSDDGEVKPVANLANLAVPATGTLGQLVKLADGTILVTSFGTSSTGAQGVNGNVIAITPDGTAAPVPGLDHKRRRIGLAVAADGTIYDGYFTADMMMNHVGAVAKLSLTTGETDVVTGLKKPVGLVVIGSELFIADQDQGVVLKTSATAPTTPSQFALNAPDVDELAAGAAGQLFAGTRTTKVYRIAADGTVSDFATDFRATRGVAYDATNKRLFVSEPDGSDKDAGVMPVLRILPVD